MPAVAAVPVRNNRTLCKYNSELHSLAKRATFSPAKLVHAMLHKTTWKLCCPTQDSKVGLQGNCLQLKSYLDMGSLMRGTLQLTLLQQVLQLLSIALFLLREQLACQHDWQDCKHSFVTLQLDQRPLKLMPLKRDCTLRQRQQCSIAQRSSNSCSNSNSNSNGNTSNSSSSSSSSSSTPPGAVCLSTACIAKPQVVCRICSSSRNDAGHEH